MTNEDELNYYADIEAHAEYEHEAEVHQWEQLEKQSLSAINQFSKGLTKIDIKEMAGNVIENLLINGNPLQIAEALSAMEMFIKEVKDDKRFKDYAREEIAKHKGGYVSKSGAKIELAETGTSYDFSKCNDVCLRQYEIELEAAKLNIDARKSFLKTIPVSGLEILVDDELIKIYPPSKSSTSSYKVSLAKGF